ncbi:cholecystokinin receptor type A-like [Liolophura sinensis]|uniref:cholecystokinin receptor type A-like n=1 Tax=Liolophura sinensis TaxID=3198878 RepID=UPI00315864E5
MKRSKVCGSELLSIITANLMVKSAPLVTYMVILMLVGIVGNGLVILVYQRKKIKTTANVFMLSLAWLDLLSCVLLHPYAIFKLCHPLDQWWTTVCKVFEFLVHTTFCSSVCLLTVIAIDRYLAVCRALSFIRAQRVSYVMVGIGIAVGCVGSIPVLEFYGQTHNNISNDSMGLSIPYVQCDVSDTYILSNHIFWYSRAEFVMFIICLAVITVSYVLVALKVAKRKIVGTSGTLPEASANSLSQSTSHHRRYYEASTRRVEAWMSASQGSGEMSIPQGPLKEERQTSTTTDTIGPNRKRRGISQMSPAETLRVCMMLAVITVAFLLSWLPLFLIKFGVMANKENSLAFRPLHLRTKVTSLFGAI